MSITIHNYEAYLLDYMEGNLDITKVRELNEFLSLHPELKTEESIHLTKIVPENIPFPNKKILKKLDFSQKITDHNFDDFCIAHYEGLLTSDQDIRLNQFCLKKNKEKDFENFGKTYLKPDTSLTFQGKNDIYKQKNLNKIRLIILQVSAVAASVALFLSILKPVEKEQKILPLPITKETASVYLHPKSDAVKTVRKIDRIKMEPQIEKTKISVHISDYTREPESEAVNPLPIRIVSIPEGQLNLNTYDLVENSSAEIGVEKGMITLLSDAWSEIKNKEKRLDKIKKPKISLVNLFKFGIDGINSVTDSHMKLSEQTDSLGNITVVTFESSLIKYHRYRNN